MTGSARIVIVGGHGKVALAAVPRLAAAGFDVDAVIRNPAHAAEVSAAGAEPVLLDIERATEAELAEAFDGAAAVVFSAGAGGGNPARTAAVDHDAAVRTMRAALEAGVRRYVMVSYLRADTDVDRLDPGDSFFPYARAKHDADAALRSMGADSTGLDYTILGPASLTTGPGTGHIRVVGADEAARPPETTGERLVVSRENVAAVIAHVVATGAAGRETVRFVDGDTPIAEAIPAPRA